VTGCVQQLVVLHGTYGLHLARLIVDDHQGGVQDKKRIQFWLLQGCRGSLHMLRSIIEGMYADDIVGQYLGVLPGDRARRVSNCTRSVPCCPAGVVSVP
jgi:hypothetical protein